jgi:uncharacterized protein with PhoU and TrkA domain
MLVVARATVAPGSEIAGRDLGFLHDGPYARVLKLTRDDLVRWAPAPDTVLNPGDELIVVATRKGLDGLLKLTQPEPEAPPNAVGRVGRGG